jgi:hypothetical protein
MAWGYRLFVGAYEDYLETGPTNGHVIVDQHFTFAQDLFDPKNVDETNLARDLGLVMELALMEGVKRRPPSARLSDGEGKAARG